MGWVMAEQNLKSKWPSDFGLVKSDVSEQLGWAKALSTSRDGLFLRYPHFSAHRVLSAGQAAGFKAVLGAALVFWMFAPEGLFASLCVLCAALFSGAVALRASTIFHAIVRKHRSSSISPYLVEASSLPRFTLLIPVYKEHNVVAQSVKAMLALAYPSDKLEVFYLTEADDHTTITALKKETEGTQFKILCVPPCEPRTKPKALNFGLEFATGDIVTIYDAEDIPHPEQLLLAARKFRDGSENLAVVQAPLQPHNAASSWFASQFTLEYGIHFGVWLPALTAFKFPIALGGTSNHFKSEALRKVGAWDPFNVTEDADLGLRLAAFGYSSAMIPPPTLEEAPVKWRQWLPQRTRWIKGHVLSWLIMMRRPLELIKSIGLFGFLSVQLSFGASTLSSLLHGPLIIAALCIFSWDPSVLFTPYAWMFFAGYATAICAALVAETRRAKSWKTIATMPIYWALQSAAGLIAIWELFTRPHVWAKSDHGLDMPDQSQITDMQKVSNRA